VFTKFLYDNATLPSMADYLENAAKGREMAAATTDEKSREHWQRMETYWLELAALKDPSLNLTDIVKI
jgi:hypothetical protein